MSKKINPVILAVIALVLVAALAWTFGAGDLVKEKLLGFGNNQDNTVQEKDNDRESTENGNNAVEETVPEVKEPPRQRLQDVKARAVYLSGDSAASSKVIDRIIQLTKTTDLNAVVIDVKENGKVNYNSSLPEVEAVKAEYATPLYDAESLIQKLHDNNIYVIGRVVCFRDPVLSEKRPELAVKKVNGQLWKEGKFSWTNPYEEEVWQYNIDIAKEAISKGFDEIQFDYVRFPTTKKSEVSYGENMPTRAETINKFLKMAREQLVDELGDVPISADVFGIICESPGDREGIGQDLEQIGKDIEYISPMVYPSHYANASRGSNGNGVGQSINGVLFTAPDLAPYEVVYNSIAKAAKRTGEVEGYKAKIRPYLQAFTARWLPDGYYKKYGVEEVRQQIKAVYDAGGEEWILWDPSNNYLEAYFDKK